MFGILDRGMSRREAGRLRSRSLAPSLLSCPTPVDRRIKEDAPVETDWDLKRCVCVCPRSPRNVYRAMGQKQKRKRRKKERERGVNGGSEFTPSPRVFGEDTSPVYIANVGSNSSWLVATKSIPDSPPLSSRRAAPCARVLLVPGSKYPRYWLPEGSLPPRNPRESFVFGDTPSTRMLGIPTGWIAPLSRLRICQHSAIKTRKATDSRAIDVIARANLSGNQSPNKS